MAFPSTLLSLAAASGSNFLNVCFGGVTAMSTGLNAIIADLLASETKIGTGASTPTASTVLGGTGTGTSAWTASPTVSGLLTAAGVTISGNVAIVPAPVSGTPAQHGLFRENVPKMWCHYTSVTTTAILASYNVASLTDGGTGITTITIDRDFATANYSTVGGVETGGFATVYTSKAAGSVIANTFNSAATLSDCVADTVAMGAQ